MYWNILVFQSVLNEMCFQFFLNSLKAIKPLKEFIKVKTWTISAAATQQQCLLKQIRGSIEYIADL